MPRPSGPTRIQYAFDVQTAYGAQAREAKSLMVIDGDRCVDVAERDRQRVHGRACRGRVRDFPVGRFVPGANWLVELTRLAKKQTDKELAVPEMLEDMWRYPSS